MICWQLQNDCSTSRRVCSQLRAETVSWRDAAGASKHNNTQLRSVNSRPAAVNSGSIVFYLPVSCCSQPRQRNKQWLRWLTRYTAHRIVQWLQSFSDNLLSLSKKNYILDVINRLIIRQFFLGVPFTFDLISVHIFCRRLLIDYSIGHQCSSYSVWAGA